MKKKHIPVRTCVACRETDEKRDLMRIVRLPDGTLCYDPKGKLSGRGAYLCARPACVALARKQRKLERSLKIEAVPPEVFARLEAIALASRDAEGEPDTPRPEAADAKTNQRTEQSPLTYHARQDEAGCVAASSESEVESR